MAQSLNLELESYIQYLKNTFKLDIVAERQDKANNCIIFGIYTDGQKILDISTNTTSKQELFDIAVKYSNSGVHQALFKNWMHYYNLYEKTTGEKLTESNYYDILTNKYHILEGIGVTASELSPMSITNAKNIYCVDPISLEVNKNKLSVLHTQYAALAYLAEYYKVNIDDVLTVDTSSLNAPSPSSMGE